MRTKAYNILVDVFNSTLVDSIHDWEFTRTLLMGKIPSIDLNDIPHREPPMIYKTNNLIKNGREHQTAIVNVNQNKIEIIHEDVYEIEITSLYFTILAHLIESNILDYNDNKVYLLVYYLISEKSPRHEGDISEDIEIYYKWWLCRYMGEYMEYIVDYISIMNKDIMNNMNWLYIDTDKIYVQDCSIEDINILFEKYGLLYDIDIIPFIYIENKKSYLYINNKGELINTSKVQQTDIKGVQNEMKSLYRNRLLESVLDYGK